MKLLKNTEDDNVYLSKRQWTQVFTAVAVMTILLYIAAMICSLLGSAKFILNYQNDQLDKIETFVTEHHFRSVVSWLFSTFEFFIISWFVLQRRPKFYYLIAFYLPIAILAPMQSS